jgi:hypothetical protein
MTIAPLDGGDADDDLLLETGSAFYTIEAVI